MDEVKVSKKSLQELAKKLSSYSVITTEELMGFINDVINVLNLYKSATGEVNKETRDTLNLIVKQVNEAHTKIVEEVKQETGKTKKELNQEFETAFKEVKKIISEIKKFKDGKDGRDGLDGLPGLDGSPDKPDEIRDKLETLKGEERLDASAIKNLPEATKQIVQTVVGTGSQPSRAGTNVTITKGGSGEPVINVPSIPTGSITGGTALTKTDDTNVTLTLGGTPSTALLQATSLTLGWTGTLAAARLNSNVVQGITNDTNVTGTITTQNLALGWTGTLSLARGGTAVANSTAAAGTFLRGNGTGFATSTLTLPNALTVNQVLYGTGTDTVGSSANMTFTGSVFSITGTGYFGTGSAFTGGRLNIVEDGTAQPALKISHGTNSDVISVTKGGGTGNLVTSVFTNAQSNGISFTNTDASTFLNNVNPFGFKAVISMGTDNLGMAAIVGTATQSRTSLGSNADTVYGGDFTASSSIATAGVYGAAVRASTGSVNVEGIRIKLSTSQAANALSITNPSGTILSYIDSVGAINAPGFTGPHNGTVGATTPNTGAFTTISASGQITQTGGGTFFVGSGSTTGQTNMQFSNTGGSFQFGIESSVGGVLNVGAPAYSSVITSFTNTPLVLGTNSNARLTILGAGNVGIGTVSPGAKLEISGANNNPGANIKSTIYVNSTDTLGAGVGGTIGLGGVYTGTSQTVFAEIVGAKENATDANYAGALIFKTRANGGNSAEWMRITSGGNVGINMTPVRTLDVTGSFGTTALATLARAATTTLTATTVAHATATTIFTLTNSADASYEMYIGSTNGAVAVRACILTYGGVYTIYTIGATALTTLAMSGNNLQLTQSTGVSVTVSGAVLKIASA